MQLENNLLLQMLGGEPTQRKPIWLMRQAGRMLPEYRAVRNSLSGFLELLKTPERAAEVTIQPVDRLGVDAAIIFSDILVIPEAMGLPYEMIEKKGPFFPRTITTEEDLKTLKTVHPEEDLAYVLEAIRLTKKELRGRVPLIGFCGAPWTIFAYMVEGQGSKTFSLAKRMLYQHPDLAQGLLDQITEASLSYLKAQVKAGADLLQVFDSWAGILSPEMYATFSIPYLKRICEAITEVPLIVFAKGAHFALPELKHLDCEALGLDWTMNPVAGRKLVGEKKVLQGNFDPCLLYAPDKVIEEKVRRTLEEFGPRHIVNLGHGVYPDTSPEKAKAFIDMVKTYSAGR